MQIKYELDMKSHFDYVANKINILLPLAVNQK